jgi:hypothetical protein
MIEGTLIGESVRVDQPLEGIRLTATKISRSEAGDIEAGQPVTWTFISFEAPEEDADTLAVALSACLNPQGGWYCDFRTDTETFVVFAERIFRYPRANPKRRHEVEAHARTVGVPDAQLDWPE